MIANECTMGEAIAHVHSREHRARFVR
jgi:hypothetical protein